MLTISNGRFCFSNTISHSRIATIVNAAGRTARAQQADIPPKMARFERIIDYVFCGSVKAEYIRYLHRITYHQAVIEIESARDVTGEINGDGHLLHGSTKVINIDECARVVSESKRHLERMMRGTTLEFAHDIEKSASDKFLIFRNSISRKVIHFTMQSTGPQLPSTNDQFSYLTGHGVEKTAIERISSIAQHIGALHKELEKPIRQRNADIIQNEYIEIGRINVALNKLMPGKVLEFAYLNTIPEGQDPSLIRPIVGDNSYLILRDRSKKYPAAGTPLYLPVQPMAMADESDVDSIFPSFETPRAIAQADLDRILAAGKIRCNKKIYEVRTHLERRPVVMYRPGDGLAEVIQKKLTAHWVSARSEQFLADLAGIENVDATFTPPSIVNELVGDQVRTPAELALIERWRIVLDQSHTNLSRLAERYSLEFAGKKINLSLRLAELSEQEISFYEQRNLFTELRREVVGLKDQKRKMTEEINSIKQIFEDFISIARNCGSEEIRLLLERRLTSFNAKFSSRNPLKSFTEICSIQKNFLSNFGTDQIAQCLHLLYPSPAVINDRIVGIPPKAITEGFDVTELIRQSTGTWLAIQQAIQQLENAQRALTNNYLKRQQLIITVREMFTGFKGVNGEGLDPVSGKSFYTPETFSRLITLKAIRTELLDERYRWDDSELNRMSNQVKEHSIQIELETRRIDQNQSRSFIFRSKTKMYQPHTITQHGKTVPKTYEQLTTDQYDL